MNIWYFESFKRGSSLKGVILTILLSTQIAYAKDVIDKSSSCNINWTTGMIVCSGESEAGQSKFKAKRAATIIAQRNLLEVIKGIRINSEKTVQDGMTKSDTIRSSVEGVVKGAEVINVKYDKKGKSAIATIRLRMGQDLLKALLSDKSKISWNFDIKNVFSIFATSLQADESIRPPQIIASSSFNSQDIATLKKLKKALKINNANPQMELYIDELLKNIDNTTYTGLLIDASHIPNFKKAMMVKLVDAKGTELYPSNVASQDVLIKNNGTASYDFDKNDAIKNKKIFDSPLIIKAKSIYENKQSDLVLGDNIIPKIKSLKETILKNAKLIILIGE